MFEPACQASMDSACVNVVTELSVSCDLIWSTDDRLSGGRRELWLWHPEHPGGVRRLLTPRPVASSEGLAS